MKPRIETLTEKKLVGIHLRMTLSDNKTAELWRSFMQRRKEIKNNLTNVLFSMQIYDQPSCFENLNPDTPFEKWAAVEVSDFDSIPAGLESYTLTGGLYVVFVHKGASTKGAETFRYIFEEWLPDSGYFPDNRPQFEILGEKYKNENPDSEEEIWIPVKSLLLPGKIS
jgi:AraC family transcriptional regulator